MSKPAHRPLRSYGRKKGHKLSPRKQGLVDALLPGLRVDPESAPPETLTALFPEPVEAVSLEIGFGAGEHLCEQAAAHPAQGFIGAEVYINGVAAALSRIDREKLSNIRIYDGDARALLACLPDASLARIFLLFPDPWPKKRHHKRRLVSAATVADFARLLRPGGELRVASDIPGYARATLLALRGRPELEWTAERASDWRTRPAGWPQTRYERKALEAGRVCAYLSFRKR